MSDHKNTSLLKKLYLIDVVVHHDLLNHIQNNWYDLCIFFSGSRSNWFSQNFVVNNVPIGKSLISICIITVRSSACARNDLICSIISEWVNITIASWMLNIFVIQRLYFSGLNFDRTLKYAVTIVLGDEIKLSDNLMISDSLNGGGLFSNDIAKGKPASLTWTALDVSCWIFINGP